MKVSLADKREFEAEIVLKDARSDLAVLRLKAPGERFPAIEFADSDALQVGDIVLAIGNPFAVGQTVTHGIVSAVARTQVGITDYQFFIQTDAAINPGNSGGALVDMSGKLVGINTAIFSRSGGSQGIGFAIPANMVRVVVASAQNGGTAVKRPWLGARAAGGDAGDRREPEPQAPDRRAGRERHAARPGGARRPASTGDLIVVGRRPGGRRPQRLRLPLRHQGARRQRQARASCAAAASRPSRSRSRRRRTRRATRSCSSRARRSRAPRSPTSRRRWPTSCGSIRRREGVVILDVANGSAAQSLGFQPGDIVLSVNDQQISKTRDLERATAQPSRLWRITIKRGGQQIVRRAARMSAAAQAQAA